MAGTTDLELNGVPVRTATPLPVSVVAGTTGTQVGGKDLASTLTTPISADLANASGGRSLASIESLYVNAIVGGQSSGNYFQTAITAVATATSYTLNRLAVDSVVRGDDGATYSAVGVRSVGTSLSLTIPKLMTTALLQLYDPVNGTAQFSQMGAVEVIGNNGYSGMVTEARKAGFHSSLRGRRYVVTGANAATIAGAVGFTATTPSVLLVAGATKALVIRRIIATLVTPGTATSSQMVVKTDTANRFSAGGTTRAPATLNQGNIVATGLAQNLELPTATAEGGGTLQAAIRGSGIIAGQPIIYEPEDGLIVKASGSLLVYLVNATSGGNYTYEIEFEEAQVQ